MLLWRDRRFANQIASYAISLEPQPGLSRSDFIAVAPAL